MKRHRSGSLALVVLFLWQTGCVRTWQPIDLSQLPEHDRVRVMSVSAGSTEIFDPRIDADSLKGMVTRNSRYAIPLEGVRTIEARLPDAGATAGTWAYLTLVLASMGLTVWAIKCTDTSGWGWEWTC